MALGTSWTQIASDGFTYLGYSGTAYVYAKLNRQDIANNKSYVDLELRIYHSVWVQSYDTDFYLSGYGWLGYAYRSFDAGTTTIMSSQITVNHNADGTGSFTATGGYEYKGIGVSATQFTSSSQSLPTIARASKPTASPNPLTIGSSGATLTVTTNRKASSFMHTVKVQCGSWSWTSSARAVGASVNVTVPYTVIAQFSATSKTATATVTCTTFSGTTQIGSAQTCSVTFQINTSVDHPNIGTVTLSEGNARVASIVATANTFVQGISTLEVSAPITVSGDYTELAKVTVANGADNKTYTLSGTSGTLNYSCANNRTTWLTITAYDKRGTTAVSKPSWTLLSYAPITLTASVGRVSATGSTATGQISGVAYGGDYGQSTNSLTVTYRWKLHDSATWTTGSQTYTLSISGDGQQNYSHAITFDEAFDYQYQYDIEFTVNDLFSTAVYTCQLMQGLPILSWDETEVDVWGNLHIHDRTDPYVYQDIMDGFDAVLEHGGQKNLLQITGATVTRNGITYTNNGDGTWKVNGTATADSYGIISDGYNCLPFDYPVTLSGCPSGGSLSTYYLQFYWYDGANIARDFGEGVTVTPSGTTARNIAIYIKSGVTVNNLVFKPMIRDARIASNAFVPWMAGRLVVKEETTLTISSGYTTLTYPTGVTNTNYFTPIIQPRYATSGLLGWTATVQKNGDNACYLYIRQGTTTPANNSKITFDAYWIHK